MHEVWDFSSDGIMCEVHPTARVDVGAGVVGEFSSDYHTESGRRVPIIGQISINGSVEHLGIPDFHRTGGPFWAANILATHSSWEGGVTNTNQNWGIHPRGSYGRVSVLWRGAVSACLAYVPRSPENARNFARRIRDDHLLSRRLAPIWSPSTSRNHVQNLRVNWLRP